MTSKTFVHVHAAIVVENVLVESHVLRRRDVDARTAFAYYAKRERNYTSIEASDKSLDMTFNRELKVALSDESEATLHAFTRLQVFDPRTCCERCAAQRGKAHEAYCDSETRLTEASEASEAKKATALDLLDDLKLSAKASSTVKKESVASEATASDDDDDDDDESDDDDDASEATEASEAKSKATKAKAK